MWVAKTTSAQQWQGIEPPQKRVAKVQKIQKYPAFHTKNREKIMMFWGVSYVGPFSGRIPPRSQNGFYGQKPKQNPATDWLVNLL